MDDLTALGFTTEPPREDFLAPYLPWGLWPPLRCIGHAVGSMDGYRVDVVDYEYAMFATNAGGTRTTREIHSATVVLASHPSLAGTARIAVDQRGVGMFLNILFWLPPFTPFRLFGLIKMGGDDRKVGDKAFDKRYFVTAASNEAARAVITRALREHMMSADTQGTVDVRPGVLIYGLRGYPGSTTRLIDDVRGLMTALVAPGPAYR